MIQPEHLKFGVNAGIPRMLSFMLTKCGRYGLLPDSFYTGLLVPINNKTYNEPLDSKKLLTDDCINNVF